MVGGLGLSDSDRQSITGQIETLTFSSASTKALKDAVQAASSDATLSGQYTRRVDAIINDEKRALSGVRALYGDVGLSSDGSTVFVPSYGGWLFAVDVGTGATRWIADLDPMVGPVTVDGNILYAGTKAAKLYRLDAATGDVTLSTKLDGEIWGAPVLTGEKDGLFVATLAGSLYRLTRDFDERWRFTGADAAIAQTPVVDDGIVYAGSWDNREYAIDTDSGQEHWRIEADNWFWGTPVVSNGTLYAASLDGKVYAVDAKSGSAHWPRPFDTGSAVRSALALGDSGLIVGARNGQVYKLGLEDGSPVGSPLRVGTTLEADLMVDADRNVYAVSHDPVLYIIETKDSLSAEFYRFAP